VNRPQIPEALTVFRRDALLALFLLVTLGTSAHGDMAPGVNPMIPVVRFEGLADYPDYVFFVRFAGASPSDLLDEAPAKSISPGEQIRLTGGGRVYALVLVAIPRDRVPTQGPIPRTGLRFPEMLESPRQLIGGGKFFLDPTAHRVHPFRVTIRDGKLSLDELAVETVFDPCGVSAIAAALAGIAAVVFLVWRTWSETRYTADRKGKAPENRRCR
jgi:hypothetical protein